MPPLIKHFMIFDDLHCFDVNFICCNLCISTCHNLDILKLVDALMEREVFRQMGPGHNTCRAILCLHFCSSGNVDERGENPDSRPHSGH